MAESDWDTVTVLRKKGSAAQAKSKQVDYANVDITASELVLLLCQLSTNKLPYLLLLHIDRCIV